MTEQIRQIALRVKELREISGLTAQSMASSMNIPADVYLSYESGDTDIPVSFLCKISAKFNVELSTILTGSDPKLHSFAVVRAGKGAGVDRRKEYLYRSLAWNFADKKAEPFMVTVDPGPADNPVSYNSHAGQEFNYVLEGMLKVFINGHEIDLQEGDSLYFDSSLKHGMKAMNDRQAKFLAVIVNG